MTVKAVLFDAYGTLFDLKSAVRPHLARLGDAPGPVDSALGENAGRFLDLWRQKQLEYTWTATIRGEYRPFDEITRSALEFAVRKQGVKDPVLVDDLMQSFARLEPVGGAEDTLRILKNRGLELGILSNGTPAMLALLLENRAIAGLLEPILSVDAVQAYKPDRRVYQLGADALGLAAGEIGFVSGNPWDAAGAAAFGFKVYWLNSGDGQPPEYGLEHRATRLEAIHQLADAIPTSAYS